MDPLDAFMDAEVMPEVQDREREEKARRDAAREKFAQQMAVGCPVCLLAVLDAHTHTYEALHTGSQQVSTRPLSEVGGFVTYPSRIRAGLRPDWGSISC